MLILLNFLASVALLIWGTHIVRTGILRVYGADLRRVLSKSVSNRGSAFLAGLGVTSLLQSSSATALITSSFVSQNLLGLAAALAIMLGADVGTSLIAQLFSLDLSWLSPLLIFFGVVFFLPRRSSKSGQLGRVAIGLGLIILALQLVMAATHPITQAQGVRVIFATLSGDPVLDMLIGALFTVVSFSSLAVVLLTATLASTNVVSVQVGLCLVLGANLGSGLLAFLVNARSPGAGRQVAFGNLLFKVAGCVFFTLSLPWALDLLARLDTDVRRQVLHFHVIFNVVLALAFIGLTDRVSAFVQKLLPEVKDRTLDAAPRFLDTAAITTPALALANAAREVLRIGDTIEQMLNGLIEVLRTNDGEKVEQIIRLDDDVDRLYTAVKLYLTQISREQLDEKDSRRWAEIISLTINLEHVGDILERILEEIRDKKIAHRLSFSTRSSSRTCASAFPSSSMATSGARRRSLPRRSASASSSAPITTRTSTGSRGNRCSRSRRARCTWTSSATCGGSTPSSARPPTRSSSRPGSFAAAASWVRREFSKRVPTWCPATLRSRRSSHGARPR